LFLFYSICGKNIHWHYMCMRIPNIAAFSVFALRIGNICHFYKSNILRQMSQFDPFFRYAHSSLKIIFYNLLRSRLHMLHMYTVNSAIWFWLEKIQQQIWYFFHKNTVKMKIDNCGKIWFLYFFINIVPIHFIPYFDLIIYLQDICMYLPIIPVFFYLSFKFGIFLHFIQNLIFCAIYSLSTPFRRNA